MSIFKESFRKFIKHQIRIREKIISQGNNGESRFNSNKVDLSDVGGKEITVDSGAFFTNTVNRQCVIRMSSGCDLTDFGASFFAEGPNNKFEKASHLKGSGLARRYILQGGTLAVDRQTEEFSDVEKTTNQSFTTTGYDPAANAVGDSTQTRQIKERTRKAKYKYRFMNRSGFAGVSRNKFGTTYGDPTIRANPKEGYGSVPMPGIKSASVRTKSAYGSLREAKVEFTCHNQRQLEALELLFMRPGIPILLEWGWNPYIDNKGKRRIDFPFISEWWIPEASMDEINRRIIEEKVKTGGNYDAISGMCKNFQYKARPDGGFDCTTEIIAAGEIIESLKGNQTTIPIAAGGFSSQDMSGLQGATQYDLSSFYKETRVQDLLKTGLNDMKSFSFATDRNTNTDGEERWTATMAVYQTFGFDQSWNLAAAGDPAASVDMAERIKSLATGKLYKPSPVAHMSQYFGLDKMDIEDLKPFGSEGDDRDTLINKALRTYILTEDSYFGQFGTVDINNEPFYINAPYIRWDAFCSFLNLHVINKDATGTPVVTLSTNTVIDEDLEYNGAEGESPKISPLLMSDIKVDGIPYPPIPGKKLVATTVQVTPYGFANNFPAKFKVNTVLNCSVDPGICLFPEQLAMSQNGKFSPLLNLFISQSMLAGGPFGSALYTAWAGAMEMGPEGNKNLRNIGHIYINLHRLMAIYKEQRYDSEGEFNDDFNLFDFIKKIWDDISAASGNKHNFILHNDLERPGVLRIIDANFQKDDDLKPENIYELNIQSNDTICRDFSYTSVIPNELSATIGVAMQNPDSIQDIDGATFAAMAKGIKSRFHVPNKKEKKKDTPTEEERKNKADAYDQLCSECLSIFQDLAKFQGALMAGDFQKIDDETGESEAQEQIGEARQALKNFFNRLNRIQQLHHSDGNYPKGEPYYKGYKILFGAESAPPVSSIIPLKFNAKLDGIGGITIGNIFRLDPSRLPKAYRASDVAFVCMGEQQNITAGQDWTTDIHGQLVLLPAEDRQKSANHEANGQGAGAGGSEVKPAGSEGTTNNNPNANQEEGATVDENEETPVVEPPVESPNAQMDQQDQCPEGYYFDEEFGECISEAFRDITVASDNEATTKAAEKAEENYGKWLHNLAGYIKNFELMRFVDYEFSDLFSAQGLTFLAPQNTKQEVMFAYFENARKFANNVKILSKGIEDDLIGLLRKKIKSNEGIDPYASDISVTSGGTSYNTFVNRKQMIAFANAIHNSPDKGEYNANTKAFVENYLQVASIALKDAMIPHSERPEIAEAGEGLDRAIYQKYGDFKMTHGNYVAYYEFYQWFERSKNINARQ